MILVGATGPNASNPFIDVFIRRRYAGLTARLSSSNAGRETVNPNLHRLRLRKDRSIPDKGTKPDQHDGDEEIDLQGIVRQLRREVAGREHASSIMPSKRTWRPTPSVVMLSRIFGLPDSFITPDSAMSSAGIHVARS
jgi:hypothetical protein